MRINASDLWRIEKWKDLSKEGQFTYLPGVNWPKLQKNQKTGNCRIISDVKEERGAALTCREGDEENIQFWVLGHRLDVQCSWTISSRPDGRFYLPCWPRCEPRRTHLHRYGLQRQYQLDLYIGCEKFPQEVISSVNYSGFGWFSSWKRPLSMKNEDFLHFFQNCPK